MFLRLQIFDQNNEQETNWKHAVFFIKLIHKIIRYS